MKNKKFYWKVVHKIPKGNMISAIEMYNIAIYRLNKVTVSPTEVGLFCFKTRAQARRFRDEKFSSENLRLLKVDVDMNDEIPITKEIDFFLILPEGTILFSKVTPFEISH